MPILIKNMDILFRAYKNTKERLKFNLIAWVVLDDHFHIVSDPLGKNPSRLMQTMKMSFASYFRKRMDMYRGRVWQNRFWDHIIRDQDDLNRHTDYIHYNPAKHGYVIKPADWRYSSMRKYLGEGVYPSDWGIVNPENMEGDFGE